MTFKHIFLAGAAMAVTASFSSCVTDDKDANTEWLPSFTAFNEQGYWNECYNTANTYVDINGIRLSHSATAFEWDGVTYYSWYGFCPSRSTDNADYTGADWTEHQWSSITGGGVAGEGTPYVVGFWKTDGGKT